MPEYEPETTAEGTVPEAKLLAFKLVRLAPSPVYPVAEAMPMTFRLVRFPTEVIPEQLPETTAEGTVPEAKLEAFRLVRFVPGPQNPKELENPAIDTPTPIVTTEPLSVIVEVESELGPLNLATELTTPVPVIIPVAVDVVQAMPDPVEIKI